MTIKHILILDDDQVRHEMFAAKFAKDYPEAAIAHTYTAQACIAALEQDIKYDLVQLDHDLNDFGPYPTEHTLGTGGNMFYVPQGQKEYTGADVAAWMAGSNGLTGDKRPDMIVVHSWNYHGAKRMLEILHDAGFTVFLKKFNP